MHVTDTQADPTTDGLRESFKRLGLTLSFDSIETILLEAGVDVTPPAPGGAALVIPFISPPPTVVDRASIDATLLHHQRLNEVLRREVDVGRKETETKLASIEGQVSSILKLLQEAADAKAARMEKKKRRRDEKK